MFAHYFLIRGESGHENWGMSHFDLEKMREHIKTCRLFPLEYRLIALVQTTIEWYDKNKRRQENCYFAYEKGQFWIKSTESDFETHGPCRRIDDNQFLHYPNCYKVV